MSERGASRRFVWSIVTAQMLVQIGAFSLPALLPAYIEQWHLTRTEAGSLVGIFFAAYLIAGMFGDRAAFMFGGICALIAIVIALSVMPNKSPSHAKSASPRALLDFRPVFRNRAAMAWIAGYTFHTWEMAGLRAWGVTFLTLAASEAGAPNWLPAPTLLFTLAGFAGIVVSVSGNEMSQRFGRKRIVTIAMTTSAALAICTGWIVGSSAVLAGVLVVTWLAFVFL